MAKKKPPVPSPTDESSSEELLKIKKLLEEISNVEENRDKAAKKSLENLKKQVDFNRSIYTSLLEQEGRTKDTSEAKIEYLQSEIKLIKQTAKERGQISKEELKVLRERQAELKKEEEILKKIKQLEEERKKVGEDFNKLISEQYKGLVSANSQALGLGKTLSSISESMSSVAKNLASGNIFGALVSVLGAIFSLFGAIVGKIKEVADKLEKARVAFAGATGQLNNVGVTFNGTLDRYGVGIEKLTQANIGLFNEMSSFTKLSPLQQKQLVGTAGIMGQLGISATTTGKNFNEMTKSLGMNVGKAQESYSRLTQAAIAAGIAPRKMQEEFAAAMPQLAAHGAKAVEIYAQLQIQAKALGMSMAELTSIVGSQFDTFEGSAKAAGRLNALLGGNYLNSVEMLNASEKDRVNILKQSFDQAGISYSSLDKFQRLAVANAIAGGDVEKANKLFGVSTKEMASEVSGANAKLSKHEEIIGKLETVLQASATRVEKQAVAEEAFTSQAEKMNRMLDAQATKVRQMTKDLAGFLTQFDDIFEKVTKFVEEFPGWTTAIVVFTGAVGTLITTLVGLKGIKGIFSLGKSPLGGQTPSPTEGLGGAPAAPTVPADTVKGAENAAAGSKKTSGFVRFMENLRDGIQAWAKDGKKTLQGIAIMGMSIIAMAGTFWVISKILKDSEAVTLEQALKVSGILILLGGTAAILGKISEKMDLSNLIKLTLILGGIALAMLGFGQAFKLFGEADYSKVNDGLITLGKVLAAFTALTLLLLIPGAAIAAGIAATVLAGIGLALISLGQGIQSIAAGSEGFSKLVDSLTNMDKIDFAKAKEINDIDFEKISIALGKLPAAKIWEFKALVDSLVSLKGIGSELPSLMTNLVTQLGNLTDPISKLSGPITVFQTLAQYLREVNTEIKNLSTENLDKIKFVVDNLEKAKGITAENLKPSTNFLKAASEYFENQANSKTSEQDAVVQAIKALTSTVASDGKGTQIQLIVNGGELSAALSGNGDKPVIGLLTQGRGFRKGV